DKHENIEQRLLYTDDMGHKNRLLDHLLRDTEVNQALVFTSTKANADDLADRLAIEGFEAAALHGDMNQRERTRTLTGMRAGRIRVLVATDVAARGLDVQGITHVFNYDLPRQAEDYVHRIGRTGRAGRSGIAISFAGGRDTGQVKQIERYTAQSIPVHTVAGLEPRYANSTQRKPAPRPSGARNGSSAQRPDSRAGARRESSYDNRGNGNTTRTDSRQPWSRKQEWSSTAPAQRNSVEADPYDRNGDRFRAELRVQAERGPYAGKAPRKSHAKPFNRGEQPYARAADDRRVDAGSTPVVRRQPQITVLAKKVRE
ncbi:MAG: helicase C-terminal domain-containing protein, partial [Betaproteobacteria bacterium]